MDTSNERFIKTPAHQAPICSFNETLNETSENSMNNPFWREDNLHSMNQWHPNFSKIEPQLEGVLSHFRLALMDYARILHKESSDPHDYLLNHLTEEVNMWMVNKMDGIAQEVMSASICSFNA